MSDIGVREAARLTGVSRQTISVWLGPVDGEGRNYNAGSLDAVAAGLGINRRRLGVAAAVDMGLLEPGDGCPVCAELREGLEELLERTVRPPLADHADVLHIVGGGGRLQQTILDPVCAEPVDDRCLNCGRTQAHCDRRTIKYCCSKCDHPGGGR